jgi:hypothetical protein
MSRRFGRYLIRDEMTDELGRGAFGRVYRAFDPNVNRYVAIKVLSSGPDPDMLGRFQDESKTAGQLEHENIVKVYDFDLQDGMPYLVMELLDGETLEAIIKTQKVAGRPLQLLDKVEIMFQVAKGLQYAHSENVIHRDIKPGNIMVLPNGNVKVMDFGIARVMDKDGTRRTRQGDIAGTVLYIAPEQFAGRDADKRTDIFAYADVYYELLTGEHPFFGNDFATVMYRITAHDPRPIREKLPECPAALESMIQRLLVKDPEIRPDRLDEVVLETQPVLQRLRRERAAVVAAEIEPLITAGDLERAQVAIRQVLQWDPLNQVADRWREQIQQEREGKAMRARAEALVRKGHEHLVARRFKEGLQSFESALKMDRTNPEIRTLVDRVQITFENVRSAGRLLTEARTEMESGQLEHAVDKAARAAELDPGNPEAPQLRDQLRQQIRSRREAALLARAEHLCSGGDYDAAMAVLSEAEAAGLSSPKITACRMRVERERAEAEKRRRQSAFGAALGKAREALYSQRLQEAGDSAEALCAEYPEEPAASELLSEVREYLAAQRRLEAINQATQTARLFMKEKRLDDARAVLDAGLRAYPRDTGISRLMEIVNTLAATQERARKIGQVVRQAHSLADGGRLDEALRAVMDAIGEFGEETSLIECKRNFQLERDQREYARGLQARLEQGRRLLAEGNPPGAIALLEDAMLEYPGEPEIALLLSSARGALAALRESEFVKQHRSQIAALETVGQYGAALALMEAALARYPGNAELLDTAGRLRQRLQEQERKRLFAAHVRRVEEAIQSEDWDSAATSCEEAQLDFPEEAALAEYSARIHGAQRQLAIQQLQAGVRASLASQDLEAADRRLAAARLDFSQDPAWQALSLELERYRAYDGDLQRAVEACAAGAYDDAEELLRRWLAEAPDPRAAKLFETVASARREAEERARREAQERARREAEEQARRREEAAVAKGRDDADALIRKADYQGAIAVLDQLAGQYPGRPNIQRDREAVAEALERQRREAKELARRQQEAIVAKGRTDAEAFVRKGDYQGATGILDQLAGEYPGHPDIQRDREAAAEAMERQRNEAEGLARRQQEAIVAKGRTDAEAFVQKGDYQGAIGILDQLDGQYPGHPGIQRDREAAAEALERQRREAKELARRQQEEAAIASQRRHAADLAQKGDYKGAFAVLQKLGLDHPGLPGIQQELEAAARELDRQRLEAEDEVRRQEQAAIAGGRKEAAALIESGDRPGAIALLDRLAKQHPGHPEVEQDRETAMRELERTRVEAAISEERREAAVLAAKGDYQAAIAILQRLARQHSGHTGIRDDLNAANLAIERQRQAAEEQKRLRHIEEAIAQGRRDAAILTAQRSYADAIAMLDGLARKYGSHLGIEQDLQAAGAELERQREEAAIENARQRAATLIQQGDCQGAMRVLDGLANQYPGHPGIRGDREAARRELERQRREAEEAARRQRDAETVARGRRDAAALMTQGDHRGALALLDRLAGQYPADPEIRLDRDAAQRDLDRQLLEAEEQARRQRDEAAIAKARGDASAMIQNGDLQAALAMLDWFASQFPDHLGIRQDREAAGRQLEILRRDAEERARRKQELLAIAKVREEAAGLVRQGEYQQAMAVLDRLAGRYPADPEIRADRDAAAAEWERQRAEIEERAKGALSAFSARQRDVAATAAGGAAPIPVRPTEDDAEQRAKAALAALSARKQAAPNPADRAAPAPTPNSSRVAARLAAKGRGLLERLHREKR